MGNLVLAMRGRVFLGERYPLLMSWDFSADASRKVAYGETLPSYVLSRGMKLFSQSPGYGGADR